jgi:hypothetical protein
VGDDDQNIGFVPLVGLLIRRRVRHLSDKPGTG